MLLAASMALNCPAYADVGDEVQSVSVAEGQSETYSETEEQAEEPGSGDSSAVVTEEANTEDSAGSEEAVEAPLTQEEPSVLWEDPQDGTINLTVEHYTQEPDVRSVKFAVWSENNGQDDLKWYEADSDLKAKMEIRFHKNNLGNYFVHVYAEKTDGSMQFVCKYTGTVSVVSNIEPVITAEDAAGDEKTFSLTLDNYAKPADVKEVCAAVWSDKGGQDDLKWYTLKQRADGRFNYNFVPASHKTSGVYQVHVYELKNNGSLSFLTSTSLTVSGVSAGTAEVSDVDQKKGTCKVTVSGVSCPSGITKVQIPVWSKKDQSDIYWYQAELQENGTWQCELNIEKHKNNLGTYQIHVYASTGNGFMEKTAAASVEFKAGSAQVTAVKNKEKFDLEAAEIEVPSGLKNVRFAVWSEDKGQDDLKWFEAEYQKATASAKYSLDMKGYKSYGEYQVHAYGTLQNGTLVFLGKSTFTVKKPSLESMEVVTDPKTGAFTITLTGLNSDSGVKEVRIPVWSKPNQSDIVWYTAEKKTDGTWQVKSSIGKHQFNAGTYQAHAYVTEQSGTQSFLKAAEFTFEKTAAVITVGAGKEMKTFPLTVKNVAVAGGVKTVKAAVWSDKGGQDDLKWYTLKESSKGALTASIDVSNHKTQGNYQVHVYAETLAGSNVFLGNTNFTVNSSAKASVAVTGVGTSNSAFTVQVRVNETNSSVTSVQIPVWSRSDQSDIYWYTAAKQSDGTYTAKVAISNHQYHFGTYQIHAYTTFSNGIQVNAGTAAYTFNPENVLTSSKTGSGKRRITLRNASGSASKVQFAVWSEDKGQDDIVWYSASRQSDGSWTADVKSSNHKSSGRYQVHAYVDGRFACNNTFTFAQSEMVKEGWVYENGYKFYYSGGKKLTNLTSVIGGQSSYVAKVNRTTCTITIYANDPDSNKGYIIPVIAFTCSVGLPGTPTTAGTHYTFAKYRWKELMGPSYGQYATKITSDGIYFHSVAGVNTTSYNLNSIDYNNLGIPASHGCVRLCVRDAKWIYDNCPLGMKVIVYDSGDPGPYGKPATIKIPSGQTWDPTDPAVG